MISSRSQGFTGHACPNNLRCVVKPFCPLPLLSWRFTGRLSSSAGLIGDSGDVSPTSQSLSHPTHPQHHQSTTTPFDHKQRVQPATVITQPLGHRSAEANEQHSMVTGLLVSAPVLIATAAAIASIVSSPHALTLLPPLFASSSVNLHTLLAAALPACYAATSLLMLLYFCGSGSAASAAEKLGRFATAVTTVCAQPVSRLYLLVSMIATQGIYAFILAWTSFVPLPSNIGLQALPAAVATVKSTAAAAAVTSVGAMSTAAAPQQWQHLAGGPPGPLLAAGIVCVAVLLVSERGRPLRGRVRWEIEQGEGASHHVMAQGARLAARNYLLLLCSGLNLTVLGHAAVAFWTAQQTHTHSLAGAAGFAPLLVWGTLCGAYAAVALLVHSKDKNTAIAVVA